MNVMAGTSVEVLGEASTVKMSERALRFMAMESRFSRRILGESIEGAIKAAAIAKTDRYTRVIFPSQVSADPKLAYVFMVMAYPSRIEAEGGLPGGYEQYRAARAAMLHAYCLVLLSERRDLNTAVGVAIDASSAQTGRPGGSEDLIAFRVDEWTDSLVAAAAQAKEDHDILQSSRLITTRAARNEYPPLRDVADRPGRWPKHKSSKERFRRR
jgi:hypothetical protein